METLAIHGGIPVKTTPYGKGKRFGKEELAYLEEALNQNTLFYWKGSFAKRLCEKFAELNGSKFCAVTSSGTSAIHTALGAVGVQPGDEVITAPITDMGSVIGILYQNAIPVFADLDPNSYNMTAKTVEEKITDKTRAVVVVHLAGNAAEVDEIVDICHKRGIYVIEDCAQAYCCEYKGKYVGTYGDIGCFSLNDFKHISAGDGGMIITDNDELYHKAMMFADKNYNRFGESVVRNSPHVAPNYRMSELVAAVGLAQVEKVEEICCKRNVYGDALTAGIKDLPGIYVPKVHPDCKSSYWFYLIRVDENELGVTREEFCEALRAEGIAAGAGYIAQCVYEMDMFTNKTAYGDMLCPFSCPFYGKEIEYKTGLCPTAEEILKTCVRLECKEHYTEQDLKETIIAIRKVAAYYQSVK
ncbi:MAG: DegT/DnrJ/EryC1/StrS family aminotransferase [Oscillospiraceae bacterium]|nr:DegT/DnrJ/EryC1/StrS family aminotransferase [Oscillospiraceae bacterium]